MTFHDETMYGRHEDDTEDYGDSGAYDEQMGDEEDYEDEDEEELEDTSAPARAVSGSPERASGRDREEEETGSSRSDASSGSKSASKSSGGSSSKSSTKKSGGKREKSSGKKSSGELTQQEERRRKRSQRHIIQGGAKFGEKERPLRHPRAGRTRGKRVLEIRIREEEIVREEEPCKEIFRQIPARRAQKRAARKNPDGARKMIAVTTALDARAVILRTRAQDDRPKISSATATACSISASVL